MKSIIRYFLLLLLPLEFFSQVNADCVNAIPLCSNPSFTFFSTSGPGAVNDFSVPAASNISNPTPNPNPPNAGCMLAGELNPQWLLLTVGSAGTLEFVFGAGNSANPQVGLYDWIMWPYSPATCAGIQNNTLPPIRCNWNGSGSGGTGIASPTNILAVGGNSVNFQPPINVNACEQFIICISNYSGVNTLVSFQSLGTASLSCNPNCNPNYTICAGGTASIVPVNFASLTNPSYSIQPGGTTNITGTFVVTPLVTTSYTTFITGLNSVNAVQTITSVSTVTVNPQPNVAITTTQAACANTLSAFNLGLTFNPASPFPSYTVTYTPPIAGITSPTQTAYLGNIPAGNYNVVVAAGPCTAAGSFSINGVPITPAFTLNPQGPNFTVTCSNPTITVNATDPNLTYNWVNGVSAPISSSVANFNNLNLGTWSVTGTDPNSLCFKTHTFTVFQNITPPTSTITPVFQSITCANPAIQTITTTATPSTNIEHQFYWDATYGGGSLTGVYSGTAVVVPGPGTHTYVLVNLLNGCTVTKTFTIATGSGFPTFTITSPIQNYSVGCVGKDVVDINIVNGNTNPPGGALNYTILPPGSSGPYTVSAQSGYTFNILPVPTVYTPGTYTVIGKDPVSGCETRVPVSIIQNTIAPHREVTAITRTLSCYTPSVVLVGSSNTPNTTYQWLFPSPPNVLPGTSYSVYTTAAQSTTALPVYTFVVTNNTNACKSITVIPMYQNIYVPIAKINPPFGNNGDISCKTPSIVLTNGSSTGIPPTSTFPTGSLTIARLWQGPSPQPTLANNSTYIALQPGTYSLSVQDMNNGCTSNTVFVVIDNRDYPIVNNPISAPNATLDCGASVATLSANVTSTVPLKYEWSNTNGVIKTAILPPGPTGSAVATASVNSPGDYRILITNEVNGCTALSFAKVVNGVIKGDFDANYYSGFAPLAVNFYNNSYSSLNSQSITSVWNFGNGSNAITTPTALSVSATYNQPGTYTVTLFVNKGSCQDSVAKIIKVELPSKLEVPNVFTPNGDGANDLFFLRTANLNEIKVSIYDRWGNLVYEVSSNTGNIEWDGKNQAGKEVADGTYFYIITSTAKDDKTYDTKGTVSLYR